MNIIKVTLLTFAFTLSSTLFAQSSQDRMIQLEMTVQELTLQNAKLIQENKRLSLAVKEALQAQRTGEKVVTGCDVNSLGQEFVQVDSQFDKSMILRNWLSKNGRNCTKDQIVEIKSKLQRWGANSAYMNEMHAKLNFLLDK